MLSKYLQICFDIISASSMQNMQKFQAINILYNSCNDYTATLAILAKGYSVVHDELLLHRAFSFLHYAKHFKRAAKIYFRNVPIPNAAVIFRAPVDVIHSRIVQRGTNVNCYRGYTGKDLDKLLVKLDIISSIANKILRSRSVVVREVDASLPLESTVATFNNIVQEIMA